MKIKQLLLAVATATLSLSASAAKTIDQVRIYINPGHGSFTSADRPMATMKHGVALADTAGFYESNTNLWKSFGLMEKLIDYGVPFDRSKNQSNSNLEFLGAARDLSQHVVMSRVKNGGNDSDHDGIYNRPFSEIREEAAQFEADVFISIHSNANTGGDSYSDHTNFNQLLFLYRGYDGSPQNAGSYDMSMACWKHAIKNKHMHWNWLSDPTRPYNTTPTLGQGETYPYNGRKYYPENQKDADGNPYWLKGDWTFQPSWGTQGYGVLRHDIPGFLVEGYDHTYSPGRHRAMNVDVCYHEGELYARGLNDYFGWGKKDSHGKIYGIVRDQSVTMNDSKYAVIQNPTIDANKYIDQVDNKKPLNNVKVTLYDANGVEKQTYTTDGEWNGAYMFKNVAPGTYTIKHSLSGYNEVTKTVTVTANETNYVDIDMRKSNMARAVRGNYAYDLKLTQTDDKTYTASFKSTGAMSNGKIILTNTSTKEQTVIETGAINAGANSVEINATTLGDGITYSWAVAFDNPQSDACEMIHSDKTVLQSGGRLALAIDNDETSSRFGSIYTYGTMGGGLQRINPDFSLNGGKVLTNQFGLVSIDYRARIATSEGKVYIANYSSTNNGLWVYTPGNASPTRMLDYYYEQDVAFVGKGDNRVMYTYHKTEGLSTRIQGYVIGKSDSWAGNSNNPSGSYLSSKLIADGSIIATEKGIIASQHRYKGNNTSSYPAFMAFNANVNKSAKTISFSETYSSSTISGSLNGSQKGGMAITRDLSTFAIVDGYPDGSPADISVQVYSVSWSGNTPSFSHLYSIPLYGTQQVDQMEFDHADNLYIASQQQGLLVYAIKNPSRQTVTNGSGTITGVKPPVNLYVVGNSDAIGNWDPAKAVELTDNGKNYTITLNETVTEFKISTGKGETSGDWTAFDAGNLTTNDAITNGGTVNLVANKDGGNIVLPWTGVWTITVAGDLSTLTATTTTPKPLNPLYIVGNSNAIGAWNTENAVEISNDRINYSITLDETVTEFKISTNKGDEATFNNGNLAVSSAITNGGKVNLIADTDGGNIVLPWAGVWNVTIAGDLSTLHASTSTPDPNVGPGIGPEPENAPNPDALPGEEPEDAQTEGYFAYDLETPVKNGNVYTFKFKSTGARKNGYIVLKNKTTGATTKIKTPIAKGQNTITINAYDIQNGNYHTWAVEIYNRANSSVEKVGQNNSMVGNSARIGLAIDNDETSANFGTIYVHTSGSNGGVRKINPDMGSNGGQFLTGKFAGTRTDGINSTRLEANSGKLYIAHYDNVNPGVWVYDPSKSQDATKVTVSSDIVAGVRGVAFNGIGSNRKMYISSYSLLQGFNIGESDAGTSIVANEYSNSARTLQAEGDLLATEKCLIASQYRYSGGHTDDRPVFICVDYNGNLVYKSTAIKGTLKASERGAMAITPDYKTFAIVDGFESDASGAAIIKDIHVDIFNVSWNGNTPSFTHQFSITLPSGTRLVNQMEFDHAGNLLIASREQGVLKYSMKRSAGSVTTNARAEFTINGLGRGVAPTNVVATRKCYGEGNNTTAGTVDAEITWKGDAGDYKVFYQTMRRDASGNRVYDNNGAWVEAGTATIASGSTTGTFTHKNLAAGSDYNRIYNYKVANYYPAANYPSDRYFMEISGKGRTVTSAVPRQPVNVELSQVTEEKDGVTLYSFDMKLDLSLNTDVFNASLRDDNDEPVKATKYVIVVDEATANVLNAASNVKEVGRFYRGPATMTANNCNHYVINDWYMVVDFDDVTPTGDLTKANKTLIWKNVNALHSFQPQVYTSAVRTFNFTATDATIPGNPDANALTMTFPAVKWIWGGEEDAEGRAVLGMTQLAGDYSSFIGNEDYPMGVFRKKGDTTTPTNPMSMSKANIIGTTGAMIEPLALTDEILGYNPETGKYDVNTWRIAYSFDLYEFNTETNQWDLLTYASLNHHGFASDMYSNTQKRSVDVLNIPFGYDEKEALDGRKRYVFNADKTPRYKFVSFVRYDYLPNGDGVDYNSSFEKEIVVKPNFAAPSIAVNKSSPGYLYLEKSTHWDEGNKDDSGEYINGGYYKYYYDAVMDLHWDDFNDNVVRHIGFHATPKFSCVGHTEKVDGKDVWVPYHAASLLTDAEVLRYNTGLTGDNALLEPLGYNGTQDWSEMLNKENHIPMKIHYVWAGNELIKDKNDAGFAVELSADYPIFVQGDGHPFISVNSFTGDSYDLTPKTRSTSTEGDLFVVSSVWSYGDLYMDGIAEGTLTGVEDVAFGKGVLMVYPNPAQSEATIRSTTALGEVKIFTVDGQLVKEFESDDTKAKLNVSDLTSGVYVVSASGTTTRMIKK